MTDSLTAELHPVWVGGSCGYRYDVTWDGEHIVKLSRDPEPDLARALLTKGIKGMMTVVDGKTAKPRTLVNIEKAARIRVTEEDRDGLRIRRYGENPDSGAAAGEPSLPLTPLRKGDSNSTEDRYLGSGSPTSPQQNARLTRSERGPPPEKAA
jgi:hypothetical protein